MRVTKYLNGNWKFLIDPYNLGEWMWQCFKKIPKDNNNPESDDINWPVINVPGNWEIAVPSLKDYTGIVWHFKEFNLPEKMMGNSVFLRFEGVNARARVWLNGKEIGQHIGGYTPFEFDITSNLQGRDNFLAVKVDNSRREDGAGQDVGWKNFGGIYRDVFLYAVEDVKIQWQAVFPRLDLKKGSAILKTIHHLQNLTNEEKNDIRFEIKITAPDGKEEKTVFETLDFLPDERKDVEKEIQINDVEIWSPSTPELYSISSGISKQSKSLDRLVDNFGIRKVETKGRKIFLNGKEIFLKGINKHDAHPLFGKALPEKLYEEDLRLIKNLGFNAVRMAHYPHSPKEIRLADKLGLLVFSEIPAIWRIDLKNPDIRENIKKQLKEMVMRDINCPSIILWSLGNEIISQDEQIQQFLIKEYDLIRKLDNTRLISIDDSGPMAADKMDTINMHDYGGWYYGESKDIEDNIKKYLDKFPEKPVLLTEFGAGARLGIRNKEQWSEDYQARLISETIKIVKKNECAGYFIWVFADFNDPSRTNNIYASNEKGELYNRKGIFDEYRRPKLAVEVVKKINSGMEE